MTMTSTIDKTTILTTTIAIDKSTIDKSTIDITTATPPESYETYHLKNMPKLVLHVCIIEHDTPIKHHTPTHAPHTHPPRTQTYTTLRPGEVS
jgi:hypothetical protein